MSTKRPGDLGVDEAEPGRSGLDELLRALTAAPSPAELASEQEALAAFRAAQAHRATPAGPAVRAEPGGPPVPLAAARRGRPAWPAWRLRAGLATAAAAILAATIGAAYAEALPAPVQRAAFHVLGFAGVPGPGAHPGGSGQGSPSGASSPSGPGRSTSSGQTGTSQGGSGPGRSGHGKQAPGRQKSREYGPPSGPPGALTITIAAQQAQIAAGTRPVLSARTQERGRPAGGIRLLLQERPAGQARWSNSRAAGTLPDGTVVVRAAALTTNTTFRFTDGSGDISATVTVTVVLPVKLQLVHAHGNNHASVVIRAPLARPGDKVILQAQVHGRWQDMRTRQFGQYARRVDVALTTSLGGARIRAFLPPTAAHAASFSAVIRVPSVGSAGTPHRARGAARLGQRQNRISGR